MLSSTVTSLKFVHCNPSMLTLLFSQKLFRILLLKKIICYRILNGSHTNVVTSGGHVDLPRMQRVAPSFSVSRIILVFLLTILMLVGTIARNIWEKMRGSAERVRFALFSAIHVSRNSVMGWRSRKWYYELIAFSGFCIWWLCVWLSDEPKFIWYHWRRCKISLFWWTVHYFISCIQAVTPVSDVSWNDENKIISLIDL